jgi:hypothetical protein
MASTDALLAALPIAVSFALAQHLIHHSASSNTFLADI